jgi:osmotically-inducible protein OsmY
MGTVTLTGSVENDIEKELAEELVLGIKGVKTVDNQLTVLNMDMDEKSEKASQFTDAKISTVITSRLLYDSEVSGLKIDVDVDNRKVTLNGTVATAAERDLAVNIAKNTKDVDSVMSKLVIKKTEK